MCSPSRASGIRWSTVAPLGFLALPGCCRTFLEQRWQIHESRSPTVRHEMPLSPALSMYLRLAELASFLVAIAMNWHRSHRVALPRGLVGAVQSLHLISRQVSCMALACG